MSLDHLWAGWRTDYVTSASTPDISPDDDPARSDHTADDPAQCVFCRIAASGPPSADNGVLWRGALTYAVLNAYPYASGHLMVLPVRHLGSLADLSDDEAAELWSALRRGVQALETPPGGRGRQHGGQPGPAAGAGIPRHLHLHAVPRWRGDTNFMTTVAGTRVLPEALGVTWQTTPPGMAGLIGPAGRLATESNPRRPVCALSSAWRCRA